MKTIKIRLAIIAFMMFGAAMMLHAQEKKATIPNDQAWLQKFVGKWSGNITSTDDKQQSTSVVSQMDYTAVGDGSGVYGVESFDNPKPGKYRASYLLGYDKYEKKVHFYVVSNSGVCHDHSSTWKSADHLYLEYNGRRNGEAFQEQIDLVFRDKNTIEYSETDYLDGRVVEKDKGTFKKIQ